jgi:acyl carrier protein
MEGMAGFAASLTQEKKPLLAQRTALCFAAATYLKPGAHLSAPHGKGRLMDDVIRTILAEHSRILEDVTTIGENDDLFELGMTSHASVSVMLALEDEFDLEFPETMLRKSTFESIAAIRVAISGLISG